MRLNIKAKQIAGVVTIVGFSVAALSVLHLASIARVSLEESGARGELLGLTIFNRARAVVPSGSDLLQALREDAGLRSIIDSSGYAKGVTYAAIVDTSGRSVIDSMGNREGEELPRTGDFETLLAFSPLYQLIYLYYPPGRAGAATLEMRRPLLQGDTEIGSIRIGLSTVLVRNAVDQALKPAIYTTILALLVAALVASLFAQLMLRPIHIIRSGLSRLGRGELGVKLDLPKTDEFGELGAFFNNLSAQLSADRNELVGERAKLESIVEYLEDAVALFNAEGDLLFANPGMRAALPPDPVGRHVGELFPSGHPYRGIVEETLASGESRGPQASTVPGPAEGSQGGDAADAQPGERLLLTHAVRGTDRTLIGVMLVSRNLEHLSRVFSTVSYSRKLVALGRLSAGVAHEVKNPLNAMTIHLELLRQKLSSATGGRRPGVIRPAQTNPLSITPRPDPPVLDPGAAKSSGERGTSTSALPALNVAGALEHVKTISAEIRRLDEVLQGFLRFTRPEEVKLQRVRVQDLVEEVVRIIGPEARKSGVSVRVEGVEGVPDINGDPGMLRQAFLNLALNACQAMPSGGMLRIVASSGRGRRVQIAFEDSGVGIKPDHLAKIFNLYFTTKEQGSGIGLSMVYRTVQLHDGEIEVQSTEGHGSTFRLLLPQAQSVEPAGVTSLVGS
jgi:signal transduction histidine kinase